MLRLLFSSLLLSLLVGCASGPEVRYLSVSDAREYTARQVGNRLPTVKLRDEYQRWDMHISGGQPFRCNGQQSRDTHVFLQISAPKGNYFDAVWLQVNTCGEIQERLLEGRFDDQYVYLHHSYSGTTILHRLRIVDGGARLVGDREYWLEDGKFTEKVYRDRVNGEGDADSFVYGDWKAAAPVKDRRAAVQAMANGFMGRAAAGREELRRERAEEQAARDRVAPIPMPTRSSTVNYSTPARTTVKSSPSSTGSGSSAGTGGSRATVSSVPVTTPPRPVSPTTTSPSESAQSSTSSTAKASSTSPSADTTLKTTASGTTTGKTGTPAKTTGGALIIDTKAADQRKAFEAQEAARAKQAAAAKAEQAAAADALRAKLDAQAKADQERALAEMKARGNKQ